MYIVIDYYENPFGEKIYVADTKEEAKEFCKQFAEDTDGECKLIIKEV